MNNDIEQNNDDTSSKLGDLVGTYGATGAYQKMLRNIMYGGIVFCVWCGIVAFLKIEEIGLNRRTIELLLCVVMVAVLGFLASRTKKRQTELYQNGVRQTGYWATKEVLFSDMLGYRIVEQKPTSGELAFPSRVIVLIPKPNKRADKIKVDLAFVGTDNFLSYVSKKIPKA